MSEELLNNTDQEETAKLKPDDASLSLVPQPRLNKKVMKIILVCFCGLMLVAVVIAFSPQSSSSQANKDEKGTMQNLKADSPQFLNVGESDFQNGELKDVKKMIPTEIVADKKSNQVVSYDSKQGNSNSSKSGNSDKNGSSGLDYNVYDRSEQKKEVVVQSTSTGNSSYQNTYTNKTDPEEPARKSSIFFPVSTSSSNQKSTATGKSSENLAYENMAKQIEESAKTDFEKQNQQDDKSEWLSSRKSDYGSYLDSMYTKAVSIPNEIKAGTVIPITLITGISSDLPGDIVSQVVIDVFDSITGQNLLIPKGSKIIGKYDSAISYGQNRVLLAWDRIIRPDGVSLNIKGMQGADLEGKSGMSDQVDNHFSTILAASAMHSLFDLSMSTVTAWMSSAEFLSSLTEVLKTTDDTTKEVTKKVVDKIINQQPTIEIRAGFRGNIIVSKDIILPLYDDWGGY